MSTRSDMLPFWTDAYLADTTHLDLEHHGAYFLLMMKAWRSGTASLPNDDMFLRNTLSISQKKWKAIKPYVMAFWTLDGDTWIQKRLKASWDERQAFLDKQAERRKSDPAKKARDKSKNGLPEGQGIDPKKDNKNNETEVTIAEAEAVAVYTPSPLNAREVNDVQAKLMEAAGNCVDPHSPNIAIIQEPLRWITGSNPCDLELDVLPVIRRVAMRSRASPIGGWTYFQKPVMEARNARLAGNPEPQEPKHDRNNNSNAASRIGEIGAARRSVWREVVGDGEADGMAAPVREPARLCDSKTA